MIAGACDGAGRKNDQRYTSRTKTIRVPISSAQAFLKSSYVQGLSFGPDQMASWATNEVERSGGAAHPGRASSHQRVCIAAVGSKGGPRFPSPPLTDRGSSPAPGTTLAHHTREAVHAAKCGSAQSRDNALFRNGLVRRPSGPRTVDGQSAVGQLAGDSPLFPVVSACYRRSPDPTGL